MTLRKFLEWPRTSKNALYPWWRILWNFPWALLAYALAFVLIVLSAVLALFIFVIHGKEHAKSIWQELRDTLIYQSI